MSRDKVLERVRKLLRLSDGSDFEGEINNAYDAAQKLIQEHQLHEGELDNKEEAYGKEATFSQSANLTQWEKMLANAIKETLGSIKWYFHTKVQRKKGGIYISDASRTATRLTFYGPAEDVNLAIQMFDDTVSVISTMCGLKIWHGSVFRGPGLSYCSGFAYGLYEKAKKQNEIPVLEATHNITTALAVRHHEIMVAKQAKADDWLENSAKIKLGKPGRRTKHNHDYEAWIEGKADGNEHGMDERRLA